MGVKIVVKNTINNSTIRMELEPNEKVMDIVEGAAEFWKLSAGAHVMKKGKMLLRADMTIAEASIMNDDVLELIPDPEGGCIWDFRRPY